MYSHLNRCRTHFYPHLFPIPYLMRTVFVVSFVCEYDYISFSLFTHLDFPRLLFDCFQNLFSHRIYQTGWIAPDGSCCAACSSDPAAASTVLALLSLACILEPVASLIYNFKGTNKHNINILQFFTHRS